MDSRYRKLLKTLIEKYIVEGQPIGSKSLAESSKLDISAATVRNVMAELEDMGMVVSPHISAGRIPTVRGFRFFVDTLLTIKSIKNHEVKLMKDALSDDTPKDIINQAANLLSNMSKFAGVVSTSRKNNSFRQLEFLKLADKKALLIFVTPEGEVLNRVFDLENSCSESQLQEAGNYLTNKFSGLSFETVRNTIKNELSSHRDDLAKLLKKVVEEGNMVLGETRSSVVISGQDQLFDVSELSEDAGRLKNLYRLLAQKTRIVGLLESICLNSKGVRVFIGGESSLMPEACLSVVASPCIVNGRVVGTLGVIGPTRMEFQRVVSIVDVTAKLVSLSLSQYEKSLEGAVR